MHQEKVSVSCPACGHHYDKIMVKPWGNPNAPRPAHVFPFICSVCGALSLINAARRSIAEIPENVMQEWKAAAPKLYDELQRAQAQVRAAIAAREGKN